MHPDIVDWHQEVQSFGFNYRLSDINCALGISQLEKIDKFKKRRKEIFDYYNKELSETSLDVFIKYINLINEYIIQCCENLYMKNIYSNKILIGKKFL